LNAATKTIVMLHGAFAGPWSFEQLAESFRADGWVVETPALRHHDLPPDRVDRAALATTSITDYVADLADFLRPFPEPPVLLGHSMGGLLAQILAARQLARAAILVTPVSPWGILPSTDDEITAARGLMALGPFWTMALDPDFEVAASNALNCLGAEQQRQIFDRFGPESGRALFECMFWMFDAKRASHVNAIDIEVPLLCLAGACDRLTSPGSVRSVADRYPDTATYVEFDDKGHWMLLEDGSQEVAATCLEWLAELAKFREPFAPD
jgi:pimeloyl-ACP methyl ester carboxylesterase